MNPSAMSRIFALILAFVTPVAAVAAEPTPTQIDELMHKSGLWNQLSEIQSAFDQGLSDVGGRMDKSNAKMIADVQAAFAAACAPDRLRSSVARQLKTSMSAEDVETTLTWLNSDLGKRITALEEQNSTSAAFRERLADAPERIKALTPERRALYDRLLKAVHAGDVGAAILINVNAGIVRGFGAAIPGYMGPDADDIRKQMEAQRPQLAAVMEQQQLTFFVAAYASLSDEELERYIEFAKSPAGGRYQAATITALDRALTDAANEAGSTLVRKYQV